MPTQHDADAEAREAAAAKIVDARVRRAAALVSAGRSMAERLVSGEAVIEMLLNEAHDIRDALDHKEAMKAAPNMRTTRF